ncbi:unnamed protein product [Lepeophtheirus salmonis]|uniref:(salmon louse) hypothetical protein n=1 Tax=Lepeophtheirus salmonis TaxID=72036 RepID=A0A7R8CD67_LEPSM|nr:unnamed protein product [Lepeophtheirus salmonis]CAF2773444.1 unnamed protein product [Lepeophtheirus salmonis]
MLQYGRNLNTINTFPDKVEIDDKSRDLGNLNSDNGFVGSGRGMLKITQTKGLIPPERETDRSSVGSEPIQDSDKGETNDTDLGKEVITASSESVLIPPQHLEDDDKYFTSFIEELSKKDSANSEIPEGAGRRRHYPGYY